VTEKGKLTPERLSLIRRYMGEEPDQGEAIELPLPPAETPSRRQRKSSKRARRAPVHHSHSLGHYLTRHPRWRWVVLTVALGIVVGVLVARVL
jgi:hypothetical protein